MKNVSFHHSLIRLNYLRIGMYWSIGVLVLLVGLLLPLSAEAVDCAVTPSGNLTISSSCTFPGTINGADAGTGTTNTASVTVSGGATLTIGADQTIAVGSLVPSGGSIAIITGGQIKIGTPLWMTDVDSDGYPSATTQVIQTSAPTNGRRRNLMASIASLDCNDSANSPTNTCTLANGLGCSTGSQCTSGFCTDGICCNTACTGSTCQRCDSYSSAGAGTCGYISTQVDPDNECAASLNACSGNTPIGPDGYCSGTGYSCKTTGNTGSTCSTAGTCQTGGGCSAGSCVSIGYTANGSTGINCTATHYRCNGAGSCTAPTYQCNPHSCCGGWTYCGGFGSAGYCTGGGVSCGYEGYCCFDPNAGCGVPPGRYCHTEAWYCCGGGYYTCYDICYTY